MAESEPPTEEHYGGYEQLEDGIGMIRILKNTIKEQVEYLNKKAKGNFTIITGVSAKTVLEEVASSIMKVNSNIKINVIAVENKFFGTTITVAGLLTGIDIINAAKEETLGDYIIIPNNMLKKGYELGEEVEGLLLDDYTVRDLEKILNKKFLVCDYAGDDLINILNKHLEEE
jgi:NifB/MoaA-like Fe-S oxidoreductase